MSALQLSGEEQAAPAGLLLLLVSLALSDRSLGPTLNRCARGCWLHLFVADCRPPESAARQAGWPAALVQPNVPPAPAERPRLRWRSPLGAGALAAGARAHASPAYRQMGALISGEH